MCKLILNTINDPEFISLLYGKDDNKIYVDRAQILLDLYLNTPDKGLNETPLHFAAKYGLKDVVKVLVSYTECMKNLKNKWDSRPIDVSYILIIWLNLFKKIYFNRSFAQEIIWKINN